MNYFVYFCTLLNMHITMKKSLLILAAAMLLASVSAIAQNKIDSQGRRQGHWVRTDKDGSKIYEGEFADGLETGTFTYYYRNGNVRIRNNYVVPGKRCMHEAYDEQGHLIARGEYNQKNRDGLWRFYAEDGRLVKEAHYAMGVKHGLHVVYNREGDTAEVANWSNNHRHGRWWKRIGRDGYITGVYVNGGLEGRLVEYNDAQELIREGFYKDGFKHGSYRYFEHGQMTINETWNHGMLADREVRLLLPEERFVSIHSMACLAPQGKAKVVIYLKDGTKLVTHESSEVVYDRLGNEYFAFANRKGRVLVAQECVQGMGKDREGREILLLDPQPDFDIFLDEDGVKMVRSAQYRDNSPLDEFRPSKD